MPFPVTVGDRVVASPPELAALAQADARGPGGTVVPDQRPWQWILALVKEGALEPKLAIGLGAAMLQNPDAATIAEGSRIARAVTPSPLDRLVLLALDAHDATLLLQNDPARPDFSVEDSLLRSAVSVAPLTEPKIRAGLLMRLRYAGLPDLEMMVLLAHGSLDEVKQWMPALLEEELDEDRQAMLEVRLGHEDEVARWLRENVELQPT